MIDISGATRPAAHEALTASAPNRKPRFLVFHFERSFSVMFGRGASARLGFSFRSGTGNATAGTSRLGLPWSFMARNGRRRGPRASSLLLLLLLLLAAHLFGSGEECKTESEPVAEELQPDEYMNADNSQIAFQVLLHYSRLFRCSRNYLFPRRHQSMYVAVV